MDTGILHARGLLPTIGPIVMACLFSCPASAGDNVQAVPLYSDGRGNQAWVEIDSRGERAKATPFAAVSDKGLRKLLENPEEKGMIAVPVPQLMRLIERAGRAIRGMKQPAATPPAEPGAVATATAAPTVPVVDPLESPPGRAGLLTPPGKTGSEISPPAALYSTAAL